MLNTGRGQQAPYSSLLPPSSSSTSDWLNMDSVERIEAASKFLLQSPPGEINDVLNGKYLELTLRRPGPVCTI